MSGWPTRRVCWSPPSSARHVVGIAKVSPVFPGQWWLHGLRVDPDHQGLKIGSHLHDYSNAWWLRHGDGVIRLLTSTQRVQVHHLCERTGYTRVGEIAQYRRELTDTAASPRCPAATFSPSRKRRSPLLWPLPHSTFRTMRV